jgi:hypothetical protein
MSATFSRRFGIVLGTMYKRNQWRRQLGSFGRIRAEAQSRAQSGPRMMGYSCSTVRSIYVPNDRDLRHPIVKQHHNTCIAGHAGRFKTLELISHTYWWPQISRYICKGNLTDLRRIIHLSLAKGNPK